MPEIRVLEPEEYDHEPGGYWSLSLGVWLQATPRSRHDGILTCQLEIGHGQTVLQASEGGHLIYFWGKRDFTFGEFRFVIG